MHTLRRFRLGTLAALLVFDLCACSTLASWLPGGPERIPAKLDPDRVPHSIERAQTELAAGNTQRALKWMRSASESSGLATEMREEVQRLLETAADRRIQELSLPGTDPEELADMVDLGLPRQIAVSAGMIGARKMFEAGDAMDGYRLLKKLDQKFPLHHERVAAGDLLVEIGLWLVEHGRGFWGLYKSTDDAQEVLEYVILTEPSATHCDEASAALARIYETEREYKLAIDRHNQLVLDHPQSPLKPWSQARIPHLRLVRHRSPEYDRSELLKARTELEEWLASYAGQEHETEVRIDLGDAWWRLSRSDLVIADYYTTVGNAFGARHHASRAVEEARLAGDEDLVREAEATLKRLPAAAAKPADAPADAKDPTP